MVPKLQFSTKRLLIDRANTVMVASIAVASFLVIFSGIAAKALWSQRSYQTRVIDKKQKARDQLKSNIDSLNKLVVSYNTFVGSGDNILGGNPDGTGEKDGDNARLVLDALPSKYDFPALATSVEKILNDKKFTIEDITGTDDELNQANNAGDSKPQTVDMPFSFTVKGTYVAIQDLIPVFERSIRPFNVNKLSFSAEDAGNLQLKMDAKTYYQPEKTLNIKTEEVK